MSIHTMPVAPEKLVMTFSLAQVASMIIAWEDATMAAHEATAAQDADPFASFESGAAVIEPATVRVQAA